MAPLRADRPPKRFNQAVGALIREIRLNRRMSQRDLAARTFLRPDSLSKYESGTHPPTVRSLSRIAQALRVPVDCLLPELSFEDKVDRFPRALCRVTAADGRPGWAWTEWNQPQ